jgi:hypothetical protein
LTWGRAPIRTPSPGRPWTGPTNTPPRTKAIKNPILVNELIQDEEICGIIPVSLGQSIVGPEDGDIISIDNIEMAEFTNPPLTTVDVQKEAMGRQAMQMVVCIAEKGGHDAVSITLPSGLVIRESC